MWGRWICMSYLGVSNPSSQLTDEAQLEPGKTQTGRHGNLSTKPLMQHSCWPFICLALAFWWPFCTAPGPCMNFYGLIQVCLLSPCLSIQTGLNHTPPLSALISVNMLPTAVWRREREIWSALERDVWRKWPHCGRKRGCVCVFDFEIVEEIIRPNHTRIQALRITITVFLFLILFC